MTPEKVMAVFAGHAKHVNNGLLEMFRFLHELYVNNPGWIYS